MESNNHIWRIWARNLHQWGLKDVLATFLEAVGPLAILGAQFIYLGQPLLSGRSTSNHLQAIANMLEDTDQRQAFVTYLREESTE
jgi:hypothetical protein